MELPRVILDASCLGRRKTGNETYLLGLLQGFASLGEAAPDLTILTTSQWQGPRSCRFEWQDIPLGNFLSRNFRIIPRVLSRTRSQLYHASYWAKFWDAFPYVVTIHDLSFVSFPQGFKPHERIVYAALIRRVARQARHIITVSEFSKRELREHWGLPEEKISVTIEGTAPEFKPAQPGAAPGSETAALRVSDSPPPPYILYVGNLHPRKNLVRLLEAFVLLKHERKSPARLLIVGQRAWLYDDIFRSVRKYHIASEVEFTGYVTREQLIRFYQQAAVTVYPSLYEGFGLPVLEAMACGSPVITSNTTSLPEVAGDAALLVDPGSTEAIAAAMDRVLSSAELRADMRARGLAQAGTFSWEKAARQTMTAYHRAMTAEVTRS